MNKSDILVIGVGNPFRRDDGIGPEIIRRLSERHNLNCDIYDGGTDGLALLDKLQEYKSAIIIDAVNMSAEPGTVHVFTPEEAIIKINSDTLSTHGYGIAEVIKLMEELHIKTKLKIIGIQPEDISFGEGLTEKIKSKIQDILDIVEICIAENKQE